MNITAESIRQLIASNESYYAPLLEQAEKESRQLCASFCDRPEWVSGWGHCFACPDCAAHLTFSANGQAPRSYVCPHCGKAVSGAVYDEAWVYYYRLYTSATLESAAICAVLGDEEALRFLERYFDFYADHYAGFAIHGHGNGKVMPQVLDEAVWCMNLLRAFFPCRALFAHDQKRKWFEKLFLPLAELVNAPELQTSIHNHVLWHKCAAGAVAVCFEDDALLDEVLNGELGIREQAQRGFTADGFWHEGSPLYHYYALEALTGFCQFFAESCPDDPLIQLLERTHLAPLQLSADGWSIPGINDGWYPLMLDRFADQFHRAAMTAGSEALLAQVSRISERNPKSIAVPASLLMDRVPPAFTLWQSTNLAIVHRPFHAIVKSGVLVRSHKHRDNLSVIVPPFSNDLGTPGYGHPLYKGWYQLAICHNTIAVDGDQPPFVIPTHVEEIPGGVRAMVDSGWEGVQSAVRTWTCEGNALCDCTEVVCEGERVIDWIFHSEGEPVFCCEPAEEASAGSYPGYEYLRNVRSLPEGPLAVSFRLNGRTLTLQTDASGMQVLTAKSPGNPADELRNTLILRVKGSRAKFQVSFTQA